MGQQERTKFPALDNQFKPRWMEKYVITVFSYRYAVIAGSILIVGGLGFFLCQVKNWPVKDATQMCTGLCLILTLFFAALNHESAYSKMNRDYQAAKELLTYSTATEWHKPTMVENMKLTIKFARISKDLLEENNAKRFHDKIEKPQNEGAKTALVAIFNYFEGIALAVDQGLIDEPFIKGFFRSVFITYYRDYAFYIAFRRKARNNPDIWENFTYLANKWTTEKPA